MGLLIALALVHPAAFLFGVTSGPFALHTWQYKNNCVVRGLVGAFVMSGVILQSAISVNLVDSNSIVLLYANIAIHGTVTLHSLSQYFS
jgi:hypothetical protein